MRGRGEGRERRHAFLAFFSLFALMLTHMHSFTLYSQKMLNLIALLLLRLSPQTTRLSIVEDWRERCVPHSSERACTVKGVCM